MAAAEWTELVRIYPSPGYISEVVTIFLATGLFAASGERDDDEAIDIVRLPLAELDEVVPRIRGTSMPIALMALRERLGRRISDLPQRGLRDFSSCWPARFSSRW